MIRKAGMLLGIIAAGTISLQAATISGTVKEGDSTGAAIANAVVTLTRTTGGGAAMVDTTDASGAFSFDSVVNGSYRIRAAKTGYMVMGNTTVTVSAAATAYTEKLYLTATAPVGTGTIKGTVYDSAAPAAATALSGAQVILSSAGVRTRDTLVTGAAGTFVFDSVAIGSYSLTVSATGHTAQTLNTLTIARAGDTVSRNVKLLKTVTASITGVITDSSTATGIGGAKVYLLNRFGGGTIIDSATSAATTGAYTLSSVPSSSAGTTYSLEVSATGYVTATASVTVTGTAATTANVKLLPVQTASITGTVTDSTATSGVAALAGVKITLRSGMMGVVDSTVTDASGKYTFSKVTSGASYTLRAELAGYTTTNTTVALTGTTARTVNIRLVKIPMGNLLVLVKKQADSTVINGASVTASSGATSLTGTTVGGLVSFMNINTGNYTITVSAADFTARSVTTPLTANVSDTVKIFLVAATGGTKMLKGVVRDSSATDKAVLAGVRVVLTVQGGGAGAGTLTFVDSTDATGAYTFVGIPVNRTNGSISATHIGYRTYTNNAVTIGQANQADTATFNFKLIKAAAGINTAGALSLSTMPEFNVSSLGLITLNNFNQTGIVKVFGINGKIMYQAALKANTRSIALPANMVKTGNAYIICISQKSVVYQKQVLIP